MNSRTLHLIDHMGLGGAQRVVIALLCLDDHRAHALSKSKKSIHSHQDCTVTERFSIVNLRCLKDVYQKIRKNDVDYIHCHMPVSKVVGVIIALRNDDIKIIFHEHGSIYRHWFIYNIFMRVSDNWVQKHISVSYKGKELLKETGVRDEKISVIRNFADIDRYEEDKIKEFEPNQDQSFGKSYFKVGYAGRITSRKGWKDFIECFEYVEQVKFLIAGDGDEVHLLEDAIGSEEHIHHLGYIDDIRRLFSRIDCLVIPSHWDPNPLIFYESLASKTPVLASRCDSLKEITDNYKNCLEIEPGDPKDIGEKLEKLRDNNELRQEIMENGFCFAKSNRKSEFLEEVKEFYNQQQV